MADAAWQRGYPLDQLKSITAVFKEGWGPYSYGARMIPNESSVAAELAAGRLHVTDRTVVWAHRLTMTSRIRLFTGAVLPLLDGSFSIRGIAYPPGALSEACGTLARLFSEHPEPAYARIFEEDDDLREVFRSWRYLGTQVGAGSELVGLYTTHAPAQDWFSEAPNAADDATLACLDPAFADDHVVHDIRNELTAYTGGWAQHYSSYNKRKSWTAFALVGYDRADPGFIIKPAEMSKSWKDENPTRLAAEPGMTMAARRFPHAMALAARIPNAGLQRVRFMQLAPGGGELTRHADVTDRQAGATPGKIARLHIPILTNDHVSFSAWDARGTRHTMHPADGGLYYLDQRKPHTVVNQGQTPRIHLVVDVVCTPALTALLASCTNGK